MEQINTFYSPKHWRTNKKWILKRRLNNKWIISNIKYFKIFECTYWFKLIDRFGASMTCDLADITPDLFVNPIGIKINRLFRSVGPPDRSDRLLCRFLHIVHRLLSPPLGSPLRAEEPTPMETPEDLAFLRRKIQPASSNTTCTHAVSRLDCLSSWLVCSRAGRAWIRSNLQSAYFSELKKKMR